MKELGFDVGIVAGCPVDSGKCHSWNNITFEIDTQNGIYSKPNKIYTRLIDWRANKDS